MGSRVRREAIQPLLNRWGLTARHVSRVHDSLRVETGEGTFCLKRAVDPEKLLLMYAALEHLRRGGFDQAEQIIPTRDGGLWALYRGKPYFLSSWVEGEESNLADPAQAAAAAQAYAAMHRAAHGLQPLPASDAIPDRLGDWPDRFQRRLERLTEFRTQAMQNPLSPFCRLFLEHVGHYAAQLRRTIQMVEELPYRRMVDGARRLRPFIHHGRGAKDLLWGQDGRVHLVEWHGLCFDLRVHDLANLLRRLAERQGWAFHAAAHLLKTYHEANPLQPDERHLLTAQLYAPGRFCRLAEAYFSGRRDDGRYLPALEEVVKEEGPRLEFLHRLSRLKLGGT